MFAPPFTSLLLAMPFAYQLPDDAAAAEIAAAARPAAARRSAAARPPARRPRFRTPTLGSVIDGAVTRAAVRAGPTVCGACWAWLHLRPDDEADDREPETG